MEAAPEFPVVISDPFEKKDCGWLAGMRGNHIFTRAKGEETFLDPGRRTETAPILTGAGSDAPL